MKIISLRERPGELERFYSYFTSHWKNNAVYRDCMDSCLKSSSPLPQWYLLLDDAGNIAGGAGLITNDFLSRMDLWPWICAVYVEENYRGHAYASMLLSYIEREAAGLGFERVYLSTDLDGFYEKYGYEYIADACQPWDNSLRVYASRRLEPLTVRHERTAEYRETENLVREAFWDVYRPGCSEHCIVHAMRNDEAFIPELSFVAEYAGRPAGCIYYTKAGVAGDNGSVHPVVTFGPLGVLPEFQKKGIGAALVRRSLREAAVLGYPVIAIYGNPAYYGRFGFEPAAKYGIVDSEGNPCEALLVRGMNADSLADISGRFMEGPLFAISGDIVEEFDKAFPHKEKHVLDTQLFKG